MSYLLFSSHDFTLLDLMAELLATGRIYVSIWNSATSIGSYAYKSICIHTENIVIIVISLP